MRIRTGHKPADWTENVPSGAWLSGANGVRGALVVGNPGQNDQDHKNAKARKVKAALRAEFGDISLGKTGQTSENQGVQSETPGGSPVSVQA